MSRGKRNIKENPEAMTDMNPPGGMLNLQVASTSNDESDHMGGMGEMGGMGGMGGMGSPTAVQSASGNAHEAGGMHKTHPHTHHKVQKVDPQPQGHDLRHHHGYDLRARSFSK